VGGQPKTPIVASIYSLWVNWTKLCCTRKTEEIPILSFDHGIVKRNGTDLSDQPERGETSSVIPALGSVTSPQVVRVTSRVPHAAAERLGHVVTSKPWSGAWGRLGTEAEPREGTRAVGGGFFAAREDRRRRLLLLAGRPRRDNVAEAELLLDGFFQAPRLPLQHHPAGAEVVHTGDLLRDDKLQKKEKKVTGWNKFAPRLSLYKNYP
jgi:hypothetical protein